MCKVKPNANFSPEANLVVENEAPVIDETAGIPTGAIVATAIAAGVIAFVLRRGRRGRPRVESPADVAAAAWERLQDPELRARTATATRDFLAARVGHELKPVLLDLLRDVKSYVDEGFRRAEKAVRDF